MPDQCFSRSPVVPQLSSKESLRPKAEAAGLSLGKQMLGDVFEISKKR